MHGNGAEILGVGQANPAGHQVHSEDPDAAYWPETQEEMLTPELPHALPAGQAKQRVAAPSA